MKKDPALKFAMIAIMFTIVWTLIEHYLGFNTVNHQTGQYTRLVTAIVYYSLVILTIWTKRRRQGNTLSLSEGLRSGSAISFLYAIMATVWFAIYAEWINKDFQSSLLAFERSNLEATHASQEFIASKMKQFQLMSGGSFISYLILFAFLTLAGFVVSVIATLVLRRRNPA